MITPGQHPPWTRLSQGGIYVAALWLICCVVGCQIPSRVAASKAGSLKYERANIVYELDGAQRPLPLAGSEVQTASFETESVSASPPEWAGATLAIQYPHPDGIADTARATLRLSATSQSESTGLKTTKRWLGWKNATDTSSTSPEQRQVPRDDEIWVLDVPKPQLDLLLTELQGHGFFQAQTRTEAGTRLDVQLNWGRVQKEWSAEPRLDHFINRVYREGRLDGLVANGSSSQHANIVAGR